MKRMMSSFVLAALAASVFAIQPAKAGTPVALQLVAFQIAYDHDLAGSVGLGGFLNLPTGAPTPLDLPAGLSAPAPDDAGIISIVNRDLVDHELAECVSACDSAIGVPAAVGAGKFERIAIPMFTAATAAQIKALNISLHKLASGTTVTLMCTIHPFMRAKVLVTR